MKVNKKTGNSLGRIIMKTMTVDELKPASYNPRKMSDKARQGLSNSIDTFGLVQPIIWNETTKNIVGGHQRLYDLIQKGVTETDVVVVSLSESKEKALNIALNNKHITGDFTENVQDLLVEIEDDIGLEGFLELGLDSLEADIKKMYKDHDSIDDDSKPNYTPPEIVSESIQDVSHVRMVQLYLNSDTHPIFMDMIDLINKKLGTDNVTDAVYKTLVEYTNTL